MKNRLLLILLVMSCFGTALHAQSKKKINAFLLFELASRKNVHDSLLEVRVNLEHTIKRSESNVFKSWQELNSTKEQVLSRRSILKRNYELLALKGYEMNLIIPFDEITHLEAPRLDNGLSWPSKELFRTFPWAKVGGMVTFEGLKVKEQNKLLVSQIRAYDSINDLNLDVLARQRSYADTLAILKSETEKEIKKYNDQITYMVAKSDAIALKWRELDKIEEEKEEAEYRKKLKAEAKKHKAGELYFIPVRVYHSKGEEPILSTDEKPMEYENVMLDEFQMSPPQPKTIQMEEPAQFPGGAEALKKYLKENLVLPESVLKGEASGKCYMKFVVSAEGKISNVQVVRSIVNCKECDAEAKRVVEKMPDWIPGTNNGKPVNQWYNLPITFKAPD